MSSYIFTETQSNIYLNIWTLHAFSSQMNENVMISNNN